MSLMQWDVDPLTSDIFIVLRYRRRNFESNAWDDDCDCGRPEGAHHHSLCRVSPVYAEMCSEFGIPRIDMPLDVISVMRMPLRPPLPPECTCEPADPGHYCGTVMLDCPIHAPSVIGKRL